MFLKLAIVPRQTKILCSKFTSCYPGENIMRNCGSYESCSQISWLSFQVCDTTSLSSLHELKCGHMIYFGHLNMRSDMCSLYAEIVRPSVCLATTLFNPLSWQSSRWWLLLSWGSRQSSTKPPKFSIKYTVLVRNKSLCF